MAQSKQNRRPSWVLWALCVVLGALTFAAQAVVPTAGTLILNQSSMTFTDADGAAWSTTSNTVSTTVQQVGAFTLSPGTASNNNAATAGNNKSAGVGVTVYSPYLLTNTGNGNDTFSVGVTGSITTGGFSKIEIYEDDGTGNPTATAPLCSITAGTNVSCTNADNKVTISLAPSATYKFVVAYTMASAATGSTTATVSTYSAFVGSGKKEVRTDTVTVTASAAFVAGLAIKTPMVAPVSGTWPVVTSGRSTSTKPVYTTFTLTYTNTGGAAGNVYLIDTLPLGFSYVIGSAVSSCAPGTALDEGNTSNPSCNGGTIQFKQSGQSVQAVVPSVAAGTSGSLSFKVQVLTTAPVGNGSTNNSAAYTPSSCLAGSISQCELVTSTTATNNAAFTVTPLRGVQMGQPDTTAGTPASGSDASQLSKLSAGTSDVLAFVVTNTGEVADTFNLSYGSAKRVSMSSFPSNAVLSWFYADKTTPLQDTNGDGVVDTGDMAAGSSQTVYLRVFVPSDTPQSTMANYEATVLATSVNDVTAKDASYADVLMITGGGIDLTLTEIYNSSTNTMGDWGQGPSSAPLLTTTAVLAGSTVTIPVYLTNNFDTSTTVWLTQGGNKDMGSLPNGWSAYWTTGVCNGSPVTSTTLNTGAQAALKLCVVTSPNAPTMTQPVYLKAYTKTGTVVTDTLYVAVSVTSKTANQFVLLGNRTNTVSQGSFVDYAHVATNTGANACGAAAGGGHMKVEVSFADSTAVATGWTTLVYLDADNNDLVSAGDTIISDGKLTSGSLAAGASVKFLVRVFAPQMPGLNTTVPLKVTVTDVDASGQTSDCGSRSVTDLTTVQGSPLTVLKTQATSAGTCSASFAGVTFATTPLSVAAGDCLYYQIEVTNIGPGLQSNVVVSDVASNYTTFYSSGSSATCTGVSGFTGSSAVAVNGDVITCGATGNSLPVGGKLTLRYAVQVKP
jgi:trimeric autotransporter adhesin